MEKTLKRNASALHLSSVDDADALSMHSIQDASRFDVKLAWQNLRGGPYSHGSRLLATRYNGDAYGPPLRVGGTSLVDEKSLTLRVIWLKQFLREYIATPIRICYAHYAHTCFTPCSEATMTGTPLLVAVMLFAQVEPDSVPTLIGKLSSANFKTRVSADEALRARPEAASELRQALPS